MNTQTTHQLIPPAALRERDAASYLGMSRSYLRQARMNVSARGRTPGPAFIRQGRAIRYLVADLDSWLQQNRIDYSAEVTHG